MSRNIKDMRIARTPTLPLDPFQTYLEVHQDNLSAGLKSTGVSSNEILSSGPGTVTVTDNYEALVTDMIIYANMTNKSVTMNASKQIGSSVKIWKISDYDGDAVTVLPGSGITIEGLSELKLYGKYSFVELERISATVFAIKDLQDTFSCTPTVSFSTLNSGISYTTQVGRITRRKNSCQVEIYIAADRGASTGSLSIMFPTIAATTTSAQNIVVTIGISGTNDIVKITPASGGFSVYKIPFGSVTEANITGSFTIRGSIAFGI